MFIICIFFECRFNGGFYFGILLKGFVVVVFKVWNGVIVGFGCIWESIFYDFWWFKYEVC